MQLPLEIQAKIDALTQGLKVAQIQQEGHALSAHYKKNRDDGQALSALTSKNMRLSYLVTRLPATYAAVRCVLEKIPGESVVSLLDVGAGPGTASLAAREVFPNLSKAVLVEKDKEFIRIGKQLLEGLCVEWVETDLCPQPFPSSDLVIASYSLGELGESERVSVLERLWNATGQFLVLIEPGTPAAFAQMKQMREVLLEREAHLFLPCPHTASCPLSEPDWCHFLARVERTSLHRKCKSATLNYEDEKFCYMAFSKQPFSRCSERVIRRPLHQPGLIKLQVCSRSGIQEKIITKKNKEEFRRLKKIKCGDIL